MLLLSRCNFAAAKFFPVTFSHLPEAQQIQKERKLLLLLSFLFFAHVMDFVIMMPMGDILMRELHINPKQFSILLSAYSIMAFLMGLVSAMFTDKFDRRSALLFTVGGFTIGTFVCGFVNDYHLLLAARALTGAFGGVTGGIIFSIVGDVIPFERRGKSMGIITASFSFASIAGIPFGLWLATHYHWQVPFVFFGFFSTAAFIAAWKMIPPINGHIQKESSSSVNFQVFGDVFRDINLTKGIAATFLMTLGHFMVVPFITPALIRNNGMSQEEVPMIYVISGIFSLISSPIFGRMTDKYGTNKVYSLLVVLSIFPIIALTQTHTDSLSILYTITTLFIILASGRFVAANTLITASVDTQRRGGFMSIRSSIVELAEGAAAILGGMIVTMGATGHLDHYDMLGYISLIITGISVLLVISIKKVE